MNNANATAETVYTNPHKTQWDWDTQTGFPVKAKVITKTLSFTSLTASLFIAAAVIVGAFILTSNNNESDLGTTQDAMTETPKETQSSSNNAQESAGTMEPTPRIPEQNDNFLA